MKAEKCYPHFLKICKKSGNYPKWNFQYFINKFTLPFFYAFFYFVEILLFFFGQFFLFHSTTFRYTLKFFFFNLGCSWFSITVKEKNLWRFLFQLKKEKLCNMNILKLCPWPFNKITKNIFLLTVGACIIYFFLIKQQILQQ